MHLLLVGISHRTAPIELRERVDFQARGIENALRTLAARAPRGARSEMAVLSTCNRAELYIACEDVAAARSELVSFVSAFHGVDVAAIEPHVYEVADIEAARHLFRVAAGLDSLVMGEPQILGQVKEAHGAARHADTAGRCSTACSIRRLPWASASARKPASDRGGFGRLRGGVAREKDLRQPRRTHGGRSRRGRNGQADGPAHEVAGCAPRHHRQPDDGACGRTAEAIGGASAAHWDDMDAALAASDMVITATGAGAPMLTKARVEAVMRPRRNRPLFIIDIAVPRDVEAATGEIEQVFLYNIDDLQAAVRENLARRASEVTRAEAIVDEELEKFGSWLRARGVIPTVVALRQSFESIRRAELDRLDFKLSALPPEARDEARARVDEITHLIVEKLLLTPTEQLKALGDPETAALYAEAIARVFGLAEGAPDSGGQDVPDAEDGQGDTPAERTRGRVQPFSRGKSRGQR